MTDRSGRAARRLIATAAMLVLASAGAAGADDSLPAARNLYAAAAYEEALAVLDRLRSTGVTAEDAFAVEEYRAFCLIALGRAPEAEVTIEALVTADPLYRPSADMSPRVRSAFSEVRQRLLPSIVPRRYAQAKAHFEHEDFAASEAGFALVLRVLDDPDIAAAAADAPLSDFKMLAASFQELSARALAPPPQPEPVPEPEPAPEPPSPPRIYTTGDPRVVPPTIVRQELPGLTGRLSRPTTGVLEVVIDEQGRVEAATIRETVTPAYDRLALDAARTWRYVPATVDGTPVKFRKLIQIAVSPTR